jgi:D-alanine-D-alanine ligase
MTRSFSLWLYFLTYSSNMRIDILTGGISSERHIALESAKHLYEWIRESGYDSRVWTLPEERDIFLSTHHQDDAVIPIYHGIYGEDGVIQGFLEVMWIPYLGPRI